MKSKPRSTIKNHENTDTRTIGRRTFLKLAGSVALAAVIYGCGGNPARVAPTASPTVTPQPTGTATATPQPTATATITPTPTPVVPEWATDHLKKHNALLEVAAGGEYFYTATKEVTTRSGEKRVIDVRMLEYNKDTKEWIPCYQTAADLLKKEQLQTLFALNNITKPEEAVWLVRPDVAKGTEDLIKVADIFDAYAATRESKYWPFRVFSDRDPHGANVLGAEGGVGIHRDERWESAAIDGVNTRDPRGWLMMRRGSNQQVVAGFMTMEKPGMIFAGFDNLVFTAKTKTFWGKTTKLADALGKFSNPSGDICRLAGMVLTPEYTQYCADQQTAWKQVQAYWSGLPAADQKYMAEMAALNKPTPESDPNCPWMARLRGLIVWFDNAVSSQNYKSA